MPMSNWKDWRLARILRGSRSGGDPDSLQSTSVVEGDGRPRILSEPAADAIPRPARRVPINLVAGTSSLGLKVHQHLAEAEPEKNLVVSPVSLQLILAIAATGAKNETREEIARALGADGMLAEDWQSCYENLLQTLRYSAQDQELSLANSAWISSDYHLSADFEQVVIGTFGGEARSLGGTDPVAQINNWVAEKTGGKIPRMLEHLSDEQRLMLISCVYFKGLWAVPFEVQDTKQRTFHAPSGDQQRPFMHVRGGFNYFEDGNIQAVKLRYGSRGGLVCMVILPSRRLGLRQFLRQLEPSFWYSLRNAMDYRTGLLALPRFRVEGSMQLNESLKAAGIQRAFDPNRCDFSGMLREPDPLWIGTAQQNTFLEVNEKGTEAAAASFLDIPVMAALHSPPPPPPFEMIVDRPFFCAIGDISSGLILFTASVWEV